jgi:hypothetical protein
MDVGGQEFVPVPEASSSSSSSISSQLGAVDHEKMLFQALVNEGKHFRVLQAKRPQFVYDEKRLREAAAAEVSLQNPVSTDLNSSRKRKHLSAEDKAKLNRDRNREHAKNTRLRKKAYVAKLTNLVNQLSRIKEVESCGRRLLGERIARLQSIRKNAVRTFLEYRSFNVLDRVKWTKIMDENVVTTMPITPFRWFHKADIVNSERVLVGIDALMRDNASQSFMANNIGRGNDAWKCCITNSNYQQQPLLIYHIQDEDMIAAGELVMCCYILSLDNSSPDAERTQCSQSGMLQCKFNRANKIVAVEFICDVMGFMQQLQRSGLMSPENSIVPNTLSMALQPSNDPRIIVRIEAPFPVVHMNEAWTNIKPSSHMLTEVQYVTDAMRAAPEFHTGKNPLHTFQQLFTEACTGRPVSGIVPVLENVDGKENETAMGLNFVKILPLADRGDHISHVLISLMVIPKDSLEYEYAVQTCSDQQPAVHMTMAQDVPDPSPSNGDDAMGMSMSSGIFNFLR